MNKEQWENAARFAGLEFTGMVHANTPCVKRPPESRLNEIWVPHEDWRDFGPLWVKMHHWTLNTPAHLIRPEIVRLMNQFNDATYTKDHNEQQFMQAGCLLGAAIGATMGEKS